MTDTMTRPTTKAELLAYTEETWRGFAEAADARSEAEWTGLTDAGGWSIKDHVAHVVGWVRAEIALLQHRTPLHKSAGIPDAVWQTGDFALINDEARRQTINDAPAAVRAERDRVFRKLVEVVSRFAEDDFARPANDFGLEEPGKSLLAVLIEYHGDHFKEHRGYIERLGAQG